MYKVIFKGEYRITHDGADGLANGWILSNSELHLSRKACNEGAVSKRSLVMSKLMKKGDPAA